MSKQTLCPNCQSKGNFVFMIYSPRSMYYICPECKGVFTPAPPDDDGAVKMVEDEIATLMREKYKANLPAKEPIPCGEALKGAGGGKCKGRSRKGDLKKKSLAQINAGLAGKCGNFNA